MSIGALVAELAAARTRLVEALQAEYFTDDLELPADAYGWDEERMRSFFEAGGEAAPPPAAVAPPVSRPAGRPAIVCLGDGCVELASHALTAESVKHEKSPPLASDVLVNEGLAAPVEEQGPGWLALLARDYAWRSAADVVNRGHSGCTTRLALDGLAHTLASLPVSRAEDVLCVILQFGAADASAEGALHVPPAEFESNLAQLVDRLRAALPSACVVVMTPPVIVDAKWQECHRKHNVSGGALSMAGVKPYVAAAANVVKAAKAGEGCTLLDLNAGMTTRLMQFNDALGKTGRHLSQKGNNFAYRMLKEHLTDSLKIGPRALTPVRPAALVAAYPDGCDQDAKLRKPGGKR